MWFFRPLLVSLARIVREIAAQNPTALFFNGDMIYGYTTNRAALDPVDDGQEW